MQADVVGAAGLGSVLGWWCAGFIETLPARVPQVRTLFLVVAAAVAAGLDILALTGPAPAAAGLGAMAAALVLRLLVLEALSQRSREGGRG